ncbi:MAG: flagellar basal body rod C-terminal domain-containing protein, partial [Candidatus Neomarinimicrobiota bacterium]
GRLCSTNGALVLGNNGPINVSLNGVSASEISVSTNGEVYLNGQFSDQLRIVDFELPGDLQKIGANQFVATAANPVIEQATPEIHQGFLEESNVNTVKEMISLMDLQRQFESAQRVVRTVDEALSQAIKAADYR